MKQMLCKTFFFSSKPAPTLPPNSWWLLRLTYRLQSTSSEDEFVLTDGTVPLHSIANLLQHFQPERGHEIKHGLSLCSLRVCHPWKKNTAHPKVKHRPTPMTQYLCPSRDSLPKLMQELIKVGPHWTDSRFSFESRLVRVLVVLLNTEPLLR